MSVQGVQRIAGLSKVAMNAVPTRKIVKSAVIPKRKGFSDFS